MAKSSGIDMKLPSVDDLFTTQKQRDENNRENIREISLVEICDFPDHPFKVKADEKMLEMVESVKEHGILMPALVRPKPEGGYEMVAGHRRKMASELAGKKEMPCLVRNLTDDEATIIMVDSNLQREEVLPSEKAFAYKMKLDAMKRQGQRTDLTSVPQGPRFRSNEELAKHSEDSVTQIKRYIRLTDLIPSILDMVDEGRIAMRPAVELSYLPGESQEELFDIMEMEDCTPSHAQAIKLRRFAGTGDLNQSVILSIMTEEKPNQAEQFRMPKKRIDKYFPKGTTSKEMEDTIVKALEMYRKRERSRERER
ncbi:MAG: ParB/RepB/Spo0J family partition protein [Roseburia sp.]|nr:ParB/RepB/Spo0J family partition protein [Roseburia sp.]